MATVTAKLENSIDQPLNRIAAVSLTRVGKRFSLDDGSPDVEALEEFILCFERWFTMSAQRTKRYDWSIAGSCRAAVVILFLLFMEFCVAKEWISPLFVSRPSNTIATFWQMAMDGSVFPVAGTTIYMVLVTFAIGALLGMPLGYLLWRYPLFGRACEPLLGSLLLRR